jgi:gentisate 1,2-dioxygenase
MGAETSHGTAPGTIHTGDQTPQPARRRHGGTRAGRLSLADALDLTLLTNATALFAASHHESAPQEEVAGSTPLVGLGNEVFPASC